MSDTPLFGLIGYPVSHSMSPKLFAEAYEGRYQYDLIEHDTFEECWQCFCDSYHAVNVTAPYKEKAFRKADVVSTDCQVLEACNVLVKDAEAGVKAYNTDWMAVRDILQAEAPRGAVCVVGAGGAGRAAAYAAAVLGYEVFLANRTFQTAADFAQRLSEFLPEAKVHAIGLDEIPDAMEYCGSVIWCTPKALPAPVLGSIADDVLVIEANYRDPVLKGAVKYVDGLRWLKAQAAACFPLLTGEPCNL